MPLAWQMSLHLSFGETPAYLGVHSTVGSFPKEAFENSLCASHCSSLKVFPEKRMGCWCYQFPTLNPMCVPLLRPVSESWSPVWLTIIIRAVLNVTGPVAYSFAFTVLPSIFGHRVVTFSHCVLNSSTTSSWTVSPGSPCPPASVNRSLNGDTNITVRTLSLFRESEKNVKQRINSQNSLLSGVPTMGHRERTLSG